MLFAALLLAALIGVSLGLLGGGGSILTVPVLVYLLGFAPKPAIVMSLPVVGMTSLVSALYHWRLGNVRVSTALVVGAITMAGAFGGSKLAAFVSAPAQLTLLSVVMLGAAASMARRAPMDHTHKRDRPFALLAIIALGVGILTGLVGVGGGFLVVPALVVLAGIPMQQAIGTSLVVIVMNAAAAFIGADDTVELEWVFLAKFTAVAVVGALAGASLVNVVPQEKLKRGFALLLLFLSGFMLYQNS